MALLQQRITEFKLNFIPSTQILSLKIAKSDENFPILAGFTSKFSPIEVLNSAWTKQIVVVEHLNLTAIENTRRGKITGFITDGITLAIFYVFEHNSPGNFYIIYAPENPHFQNLLKLLKTENSVIDDPAENLAKI